MIVNELHVLRVAVLPDEADAVLIVDPDTVLSAPIARQRFQPIAGKCRQVSKLASGVELLQLPLGDASQVLQASAEPAGKQRPRLGILERPDHSDHHAITLSVIRQAACALTAPTARLADFFWEGNMPAR